MEREMSNLQIVTALLNILAVYSLFSFKVKKMQSKENLYTSGVKHFIIFYYFQINS